MTLAALAREVLLHGSKISSPGDLLQEGRARLLLMGQRRLAWR
jgi:hypothetical protein